MQRGLTGEYRVTSVANETVRAFVPHPLPPVPPVHITPDRQRLLERALLACGRLDAITALLLFELDEVPGAPFDDVVEVSNYVAALEHGLQRLGIVREITGRKRERVFACSAYLAILNEGAERP